VLPDAPVPDGRTIRRSQQLGTEDTGHYHAGYEHNRESGPAVSQDREDRGHFHSDEAAIKLLWLALRNINGGKARSAREFKLAMNHFLR
jgi:hypothetical protein